MMMLLIKFHGSVEIQVEFFHDSKIRSASSYCALNFKYRRVEQVKPRAITMPTKFEHILVKNVIYLKDIRIGKCHLKLDISPLIKQNFSIKQEFKFCDPLSSMHCQWCTPSPMMIVIGHHWPLVPF